MRQRFSRTRVLALLCAWMLIEADAAGRDLYVNNRSGDDRLSGLAEKVSGNDGPVRTISCALALAQRSDRVIVANTGTPYREQISLSGPHHQGSERRPFILQSDGAVIDGTVTAPTGAWRPIQGDVFAMRPRRLTHQQLFRDGKPLQRSRLASRQGVETALEPLEWALVDRALLLRVERGQLPEFYNLRHSGLQTGITLYNTRHVMVEGFVVQGFQLDGVNAHELVRDCRLQKIESRANGRAGISVGGVSRVTVRDSRFYDNGVAQTRTEGMAGLDLLRCEVEAADNPAGFAKRFDHRGRSLTINGRPLQP